MIRHSKIFLLALAISAFVRAEDASAPSSAPSENASATQSAGPKKPLRQQLVEKLTKRDGNPAQIVIFNAVESETTQLGVEISKAIEVALNSYGTLKIRREEYALPALTMEEMRFAMARYNADVLITPVIKPNAVDVFLFDKRTPYNLYAHSEVVDTMVKNADSYAVAQGITRLLVRRILYRYLNDQFFELPREESLPILQSEIPQWIASPESLALVNRELTSRFYLNASLGAALSMGASQQLWNSNLIGLQLGVRLWDKWFFEAQYASFSYNAFVGSLRYTFVNKDSPVRINVGLGFGTVTRDMVWNLDQTIGLGRFSTFIVPSAAVLFPVGEVYLKLEAQWFVTPGLDKHIWMLQPGVQVHF
ncbi:hypothetical protein K2X33_13040 [bacterium]|nr:hypothetical protein [bacterium]